MTTEQSPLLLAVLEWLARIAGGDECWHCHGRAWWTRESDGARVCETCHPKPEEE